MFKDREISAFYVFDLCCLQIFCEVTESECEQKAFCEVLKDIPTITGRSGSLKSESVWISNRCCEVGPRKLVMSGSSVRALITNLGLTWVSNVQIKWFKSPNSTNFRGLHFPLQDQAQKKLPSALKSRLKLTALIGFPSLSRKPGVFNSGTILGIVSRFFWMIFCQE